MSQLSPREVAVELRNAALQFHESAFAVRELIVGRRQKGSIDEELAVFLVDWIEANADSLMIIAHRMDEFVDFFEDAAG